MDSEDLLSQENIKKFAWHLKTLGAYVQSTDGQIVGLEDNIVISSNDAAALYPTVGIFNNLGYDTLRDRIYDTTIVQQIIGLIEKVYTARDNNPQLVDSAVFGFRNALSGMLVDYFKRKHVPNKKDATEFTLAYYPILLERLLRYPGILEDIFEPKTDQQYFLLKSCLYPLLETISWLSPQNKGYSQLILDFIFFNDEFDDKYSIFYYIEEINSTKSRFRKTDVSGIRTLFKTRVLNSYGVLYDLHSTKLSYDVEILKDSLSTRRIVKNQMLVLEAVAAQYPNLSEDIQIYFYNPENDKYLSNEQANDILDAIKDDQPREFRLKSLTEIEFTLDQDRKAMPFIKLRIAQLNVLQLGIKVSMNSGYGIFAMPTWLYASPLIGNSFTNAGKIYGTKLFQAISINILEELEKT